MRVIVTGPASSAEDWVEAAEGAGWDVELVPLLRIVPSDLDLVERIDGLPDWLCVTSANALPALEQAVSALPELRTVPFAVVGAGTAERARALGLKARLIEPTAAELGRALIAEAARDDEAHAPLQVLWPHGSLSDELAQRLREAAFVVDDPIVYHVESSAKGQPLPAAADAVLLASPSAARAWLDLVGDARPAPVALAIGTTTATAIESLDAGFAGVHVLDSPDPEAFAACLRTLAEAP